MSFGTGQALDQPHVRPMDFTGRPVKGMVFIDPVGLGGDALQQRADAAVGYARGLPPKPAKPARNAGDAESRRPPSRKRSSLRKAAGRAVRGAR
jgi:hypothetical protein